MIDTLLQDLRYALRTLAKSPGFTVVALLTLALGIGANTAMFSVVDAGLLRPLPFPGHDRLVVLEHTGAALFAPEQAAHGEKNGSGKNAPDLGDFREQRDVFEQVAVYLPGALNLAADTRALRVRAARVTPNFFAALGARPALGRLLVAAEEHAPAADVAILGEALWRGEFGGDSTIVGKTVRLNERPYLVVGVLPRRFVFPQGAEVWLPLTLPLDFARYGDMFRNVLDQTIVARLRTGVSLESAQARVAAVESRYSTGGASRYRPPPVTVVPLRNHFVGDASLGLLVLMGAVVCVLLIACANVANLALARAATRSHEIALRAALGGSHSRIVRLVVTESALLAGAGGTAGVLLAAWVLNAVTPFVPTTVADVSPPHLDGRVLVFTLVLASAATLLFGLAPALGAAHTDLRSCLSSGGHAAIGGSKGRLRSVIVMAEIALATVLLVGAGLMLKSLSRLQATDTGIEPERLLTANISLPSAGYHGRAELAAFFGGVMAGIRAVPSVRAAAAVNSLPLGGESSISLMVRVDGMPPLGTDPSDMPFSEYLIVTPGYFRAMGVPLVAGRDFAEADNSRAPPVAIINETMAKRFWPDRSPLGARFRWPFDSVPRMIVGVARDVRSRIKDSPGMQAYLPIEQQGVRSATLVVRAAVAPLALVNAVQRAVTQQDPDVALHNVRTMTEVVAGAIAPDRQRTLLLGVFGVLAVTLASLGIYGVMAYTVTRRVREIGVRIALGAARLDVLRMVMRSGLRQALTGIGLGVAGAWALTRVLAHLLYTVSPHDLAVFVVVPFALVGVAALGCYVPARRAARVDPMIALRNE
jgi:putative ABC transport system permease protein